MITLSIILAVSVAINIFAVWYCRNILTRLLFISESVENLVDAVEIYRQHLEKVYGLEMYYGDVHLQNLIDHSRQLVNEFIEIQEKYFDVQTTELEYDKEDTEEATPSTEE